MIFLFAMYLPIDYALRSIPALSFLSSAWDEAFLLAAFIYVLARRAAASSPMDPHITPLDAVMFLFFGTGFC